MSSTSELDLREVLSASECIRTKNEVDEALARMASAINVACKGDDWLVMIIMNGGLIPASWLISRFDFLFELDYLHATRYRGATVGDELQWRTKPHVSLRDRKVLLIDDILDEGITLQKVIEYCEGEGIAVLKTAVLVRKDHDRNVGVTADFIGLEVPDRYVFGCGMDYREHFRHLPEIRALARDDSQGI